MIQGLLDAHARLELALVESHSAAAPADDSGFGEKLFAHPMIRVPVTGAFYGNQGAHAAQVAAELARQRAGVDRVDASHDVALREVHNEVMITQSFDDCCGVDLVVGSVQPDEGLAGGVGLVLLEDLGVVLLVAALLVLLFTLWSDKRVLDDMTTKLNRKRKLSKKTCCARFYCLRGLPRLNWAPKKCNWESGRGKNNRIRWIRRATYTFDPSRALGHSLQKLTTEKN